MDEVELLYDHYKESFSLSKEAQAQRNKDFIWLCILQALAFFAVIRPEQAFGLILDGINSKLDMTLSLGNSVIQTLLWTLNTYVMIRYIQNALYVERQYVYLKQLEEKLTVQCPNSIFTRESSHYKKNYPMVLNFIDLFYKMLMPILFAVINTVHIHKEWVSLQKITLALVCDMLLYIAIFVITWFYFFEIHSQITAFCKEHIPLVDKVATGLRELLKKV